MQAPCFSQYTILQKRKVRKYDDNMVIIWNTLLRELKNRCHKSKIIPSVDLFFWMTINFIINTDYNFNSPIKTWLM